MSEAKESAELLSNNLLKNFMFEGLQGWSKIFAKASSTTEKWPFMTLHFPSTDDAKTYFEATEEFRKEYNIPASRSFDVVTIDYGKWCMDFCPKSNFESFVRVLNDHTGHGNAHIPETNLHTPKLFPVSTERTVVISQTNGADDKEGVNCEFH
jgi:hypothetical protein